MTQSAGGPVGMPDWKDDYIGTLLVKAFLMNDRVSPTLILARDFKAKAWAVIGDDILRRGGQSAG